MQEFKDFMSLLSQTGGWCQRIPQGTTGATYSQATESSIFFNIPSFPTLAPIPLLEKVCLQMEILVGSGYLIRG